MQTLIRATEQIAEVVLNACSMTVTDADTDVAFDAGGRDHSETAVDLTATRPAAAGSLDYGKDENALDRHDVVIHAVDAGVFFDPVDQVEPMLGHERQYGQQTLLQVLVWI